MPMGKTSQAIYDVVRPYLQNTSIHGLRYTIETQSRVLKFSWILSILLAFSTCFYMISTNLEEAELNPMLTLTDETFLDDLDAPAISILVPRQTHHFYSRDMVANSIRACDPDVDFSTSEELKFLLVVTKFISDQVRKRYNPTSNEILAYQKILSVGPEREVYRRFCYAMQAMNITERSGFLKKLNSRIDSFLMVNNISTVLRDSIPFQAKNSMECGQSLVGSKILPMMKQWMRLVAPLAFRETQYLRCRQR